MRVLRILEFEWALKTVHGKRRATRNWLKKVSFAFRDKIIIHGDYWGLIIKESIITSATVQGGRPKLGQ